MFLEACSGHGFDTMEEEPPRLPIGEWLNRVHSILGDCVLLLRLDSDGVQLLGCASDVPNLVSSFEIKERTGYIG